MKALRRLWRACVWVVAASAALAAAPRAKPPRPDAVFNALQEGMTALESGNFPLSLSLLRGVARVAPDHPGVLFQLARAEAAAGHRNRAFAALEKSARVGFASRASSEPHLRSFSSEPRFTRVLTRVAANLSPVPAGGEVVTLAEKDLSPKGPRGTPPRGACS
ncbi:MAG: hypothetical protein LC796_13490 [Acidobacteria bacterium]|nr:hypothetical protein [Acidobacteriota bacterium]